MTVIRDTAPAVESAISGVSWGAVIVSMLAACGSSTGDRTVSGAGIGAATGAGIGAIFGGVGAVPGALIGAGVGGADVNLGRPIWR